jgi:hypothetical protein
MQTDPSQSASSQVEGGSVVGLWRYPVKSMMGEELNAVAEVTERGLVGDRRFALVDPSTGKIAGAKNPRKWGNFDFRAAYVESPEVGSKLPTVRLTLPDGIVVTSEQPDLAQILSKALGHEVTFAEAKGDGEYRARPLRSTGRTWRVSTSETPVTDFELPPGTFFDLALVLGRSRSSTCSRVC